MVLIAWVKLDFNVWLFRGSVVNLAEGQRGHIRPHFEGALYFTVNLFDSHVVIVWILCDFVGQVILVPSADWGKKINMLCVFIKKVIAKCDSRAGGSIV